MIVARFELDADLSGYIEVSGVESSSEATSIILYADAFGRGICTYDAGAKLLQLQIRHGVIAVISAIEVYISKMEKEISNVKQ